MFTKHTDDSDLETLEAIIRAKLTDDSVGPVEFAAILEQHANLIVAKASAKKSSHVSPEALLAAGTNLAGILLILNYERAGVVASKALSFVQKLR